jgi:hypothetical protein
MKRHFSPRRKPSACPSCGKKGISPYPRADGTKMHYECRYCCAWNTWTVETKKWSGWFTVNGEPVSKQPEEMPQ